MAIRLRNLARTFSGRVVVRASVLDSPQHGLIALRGSNGSGKTTLLRLLATLTSPSSGEAWIDGHSILDAGPAVRRVVGFVPASDGGFFKRLSGLENLHLFGALRGLRRSAILGKLDAVRELLPLDAALTTPFGHCSAGMRQALALTRALLHDPRVLLLDEPMRSLDPEFAPRFRNALGELSRDRLVLFSSHAPEEWVGVDQLWCVEKGVVECLPPPS